ncbi:hypothetical protein EUA06_06555 [Nocardioides glacieisoli]|uniref:Uncharacterized protein n=1 Tax=Nocardioides glacieisoli TaxID=1168730 RepID=A0A4Q2RU34_9ACTN|nr:hypothetical protein [Nocardioides glacieisoli]RYB92601.1 hypothetical protein EUA06_06555 [Nocardioides glacieisoli]
MQSRYVARWCAALLLVGPGVVAAAPTSAQRDDGWSRPRVVDPREGTTSQPPSYASNGRGRTVLAWVSHTVVQPAAQPYEDPVVRADIRVRRIRGDGRLGPIRTVYSSLDDVSTVKIAVDAKGDMVVGWTEYRVETAGYRPWVRRVPRRGALPPAQLVWGEGSETGLNSVAMTPDGTAVAVWLQPRLYPDNATAPQQMLLRRVLDDGTLSGATDLGLTGIAADVVAGEKSFWVSGNDDPLHEGGTEGDISAVRIDRRGRVTDRTILDTAQPGLESYSPTLTLDGRQDARVLWVRYDSVNGGNELVARVWRSDGSASRETVIRDGHYGYTSIATSAQGDSFVTWISMDDYEYESYGRAWDRRGRLGRVEDFGLVAWDNDYVKWIHGPTAWVDDEGRGIVAWGHRPVDTGTPGDPEGPIVTRVRRIRPDGRTTRLPTVDLGPQITGFVTPEGLTMLGFQPTDNRARLVVRR